MLGSSPGLWAATAASYCPSRIGKLPKNNPENLSAWWDGKLCSAPLPLREYFRISPFLPMDVMIIDDRCKKSLATDRVGVRYQCGGGRNSPRNIPVATAKAKRHGVPWELVIFHKKKLELLLFFGAFFVKDLRIAVRQIRISHIIIRDLPNIFWLSYSWITD